MFNIAQYLEKFKDIGQDERRLKGAIRASVKEELNIDLEAKDISVKNGEVIFKISPALKNAIYIKKAAILKRMEEKGVERVADIR